MKQKLVQGNLTFRRLDTNDNIPYDLLLLADETKEAINKYIHDSEIFLGEYRNEAIAVYVLQPVDKDVIEIRNIAVRKDYQGQGIGKRLLEEAAAKATARGFKTIIIGTGDASTRQLDFYQREGYVVFDRRKRFFLENYPEPIYENGVQLKDMVMLRKELR